MRLELIRVIHVRKGPFTDPSLGARVCQQLPNAFYLESCQRWLWVCTSSDLAQADLSAFEGVNIHRGISAYSLLLRVATGLESQIVGETDIFGQLKEAWRRNPGSPELSVLMQKVFEDTKDIRNRYLQNVGGASYGSLVRMLLNQSGSRTSGGDLRRPILVLGAGQLAQSVAPYLMDGELWLSNRSQENLFALHQDLLTRRQVQTLGHSDQGVIRIISAEEEQEAWLQAANVVVCVPFDSLKDAERVALRQKRGDGVVVHLGGVREQAGVWNQLPDFYSLDDLFALQKAQGDVRMSQVSQAARACEEKAKLRSLGASVTIPHGWEDLAVFA